MTPPLKCRNCGATFKPKRKTQRFCTSVCRKEFHQYGKAGIGKLLELMTKRIRKIVREEITTFMKGTI